MTGRGRFVSFEGIEGVGKSTQLAHARAWLDARGREVIATREPGGTAFAESIRALVLGPAPEPVPPETELLLMFAARSVHTANLIRPALARGAWVLCDRYIDASHAYQGGGRGLATAAIDALAALAEHGLEPDLTLLFDAPVALALARARARAGHHDRIEAETVAFFERVRGRYLERARHAPGRIRVIDAQADEASVAAVVAGELAGIHGG